MFIKKCSADEIAFSMEEAITSKIPQWEIEKQARLENKLIKAAELINEAAQLFDETGLSLQAEVATAILESLAAKKKSKKSKKKIKSKSKAKKAPSSEKMVKNLKEKGWVFDENGADDGNKNNEHLLPFPDELEFYTLDEAAETLPVSAETSAALWKLMPRNEDIPPKGEWPEIDSPDRVARFLKNKWDKLSRAQQEEIIAAYKKEFKDFPDLNMAMDHSCVDDNCAVCGDSSMAEDKDLEESKDPDFKEMIEQLRHDPTEQDFEDEWDDMPPPPSSNNNWY